MSVSRSYRRGILVVVNTILVSAILSLIAARGGQSAPRAAQDLGDQAMGLGRFRLEERSGRTVTQDDLADRVWIGSFIFTRCPLSCPRISSVMKSLQEKLAGSQVLLVSLSVDPDHDTPAVLADYARRFGADADHWWFLTGDRASIYELIRDRFKLTVMENPATDPASQGESILHSDRLALVDRGRIIGLFDSNDPAALDSLLAQARRRATPAWIRVLPSVNASLNALCALFLVLGWILIRRRPGASAVGEVRLEPGSGRSLRILESTRVRGHLTCMLLAVLTSAVFLACYLVYHYHAGSVRFPGTGAGPSPLLHHPDLAHAAGNVRSRAPGGLDPPSRFPARFFEARRGRRHDIPDLALRLRDRRRHLLHALPPPSDFRGPSDLPLSSQRRTHFGSRARSMTVWPSCDYGG